MFCWVILIFLIGVTAGEKIRFNGHQVWRLGTRGDKVDDLVSKLSLDVWGEGSAFVDIRVPPQSKDEVTDMLRTKKISHRVIIQDAQLLIDAEDLTRTGSAHLGFAYDKYNNYSEIENKLLSINESNPLATLVSLGKSIEGRDIWQLKFSKGSSKPIAWFDCGVHAREWVSVASCLYGINKFDQNDPKFTALLDEYDIHIIPAANPDGYIYSWTKDRFWRKNRNLNGDVPGRCVGVDLNRNFDSNWGGLGTSTNYCSQTYRGKSPASEPETQVYQNAVLAKLPEVVFSIHAYSQLWLYPYGYDFELPKEDDLEEMERVAVIGLEALNATYGTNYVQGPIATTIYPASGSSSDFVYDSGVIYSYAMELRDKGRYGFLLPADQITETSEEVWNGFIAALNAIHSDFRRTVPRDMN